MVTELVLQRPLSAMSELEALMLDHPDLAFHTLNASISATHLTGVFHFTGGSRSLGVLLTQYLENPPAQSTIEILAQRKGEMLVYEQERIGESPLDLSVHVYRELGPDVIFRVSKNRDGATWGLIVFRHDRIRPFLEAVRAMKTELDITTRQKLAWYKLKKLSNPQWDGTRSERLSPSDEHILETAWRSGFFSVPRGVDLGGLAGILGFSRSGLNYRLRKAMEKVVALYFGMFP